jgi:hypothetical protein
MSCALPSATWSARTATGWTPCSSPRTTRCWARNAVPTFCGSPHAPPSHGTAGCEQKFSTSSLYPPPCCACMRVPSQVAAATGFQVWEGARALKKMLEDPEMPLSAHIKGKRVLELGSGTGLAGLCASAIGGDVMLSGVPPASALVSVCTPLRPPSSDHPHARGWLMRMAGWTGACMWQTLKPSRTTRCAPT